MYIYIYIYKKYMYIYNIYILYNYLYVPPDNCPLYCDSIYWSPTACGSHHGPRHSRGMKCVCMWRCSGGSQSTNAQPSRPSRGQRRLAPIFSSPCQKTWRWATSKTTVFGPGCEVVSILLLFAPIRCHSCVREVLSCNLYTCNVNSGACKAFIKLQGSISNLIEIRADCSRIMNTPVSSINAQMSTCWTQNETSASASGMNDITLFKTNLFGDSDKTATMFFHVHFHVVDVRRVCANSFICPETSFRRRKLGSSWPDQS